MPLLPRSSTVSPAENTDRHDYTPKLTASAGVTISTLTIGNDDDGFATAIVWNAVHALGGRLVVGL